MIRVRKEVFLEYEKIRKSGKTNMLDTKRVVELSGNFLSEWQVNYIIRHYEELAQAYL